MPFPPTTIDQVQALLEDLTFRDFLSLEMRPWKNSYARIYTLTPDGIRYASSVYLPILEELGITRLVAKDSDFLVHLRPEEIIQNITESVA